MIYQLAKTSPLLSGQVKINFILKGIHVDSIQYTPISPSIPFNYNNPSDVLNYSHGDNVKMLHSKIGDSFYSTIGNSKLNPTKLHKFVELYDDTHDNTYEMGMKRLEYHKFNKQFEFFTPMWIDNKDDFDKLRFELCIANKDGRTIYGSFLIFSERQKEYLKSMYESFCIENKSENSDLLYLSFNECRSYIRGLNVNSGTVQTIDTSYIINNLTSQERTVLETDNLIVTLFRNHDLVATQLFNFNFVFNMEDFLPSTMLASMISERVNVFVNVYCGNKLVEVRDIYSNYDFIPRYDIYTGKYTDGTNEFDNVLSYLGDNRCVDIITKNKLVQHTFHWALKSNPSSIFNVYNGFAPLYNVSPESSSISNDETDMFTDKFDANKNPFGLFKYTNREDISTDLEALSEVFIDENNYYTVNMYESIIKKSEYQMFGNMVIDNKKLQGYKKKILNIEQCNKLVGKFESKRKYDDFGLSTDEMFKFFFNSGKTGGENGQSVYAQSISKIKCGTLRLSPTIRYSRIRNIIPLGSFLTGMEYVYKDEMGNVYCKSSNKNFIYTRVVKDSEISGQYILYILYIITQPDEVLENNLYFNHFFDTDFLVDLIQAKTSASPIDDGGYGAYKDCHIKCVRLNYNGEVYQSGTPYITQKHAVYNAVNLLSYVFKSAKMPNKITLKKSISRMRYNSPSIDTKEIAYIKNEKTTYLYRYDMNIIPLFISLDDTIRKNKVYWCKQYKEELLNDSKADSTIDPDNITEYMKYSFTKFNPEYPSIGYYVLNSAYIDYSDYYLNAHDKNHDCDYDYKKEVSWYKHNSMLYLPVSFTKKKTIVTGQELTENDIVSAIKKEIENTSEFITSELDIVVKYYIKDLYQYTYTYDYYIPTEEELVDMGYPEDYQPTPVEFQRITIKFTLK